MYVNRYSRISDQSEVIHFIKAHPFGILVANGTGGIAPVASHIPFWLEQRDGDHYLFFHLARANELIRVLKRNAPALAIFQGPHAYISPSWYEQQNVPTWNYQAVHVYGSATFLSPDELESHVATIMDAYESKFEHGRRYADFPDEYKARELKGIEGFSLKIEKVEAAYKLSQNRSEVDYFSVIRELEQSADSYGQAVSAEMRRIRKSKKE